MKAEGYFHVEALECAGGKRLWREILANAPTVEGLTYLLSSAFCAGAQLSAWYGGLIDDSGYSALSVLDTMAAHAGWSEATSYLQSTRPQWGPPAASGAVAVATSPLSWTLSASKRLRGLFLTSNSSKGGSTGTLWASAPFTTVRTLAAGQVLRARYFVRASGN